MTELKPCPFCNSEARLVSSIRWIGRRRRIRGLYWHIGCSDPNCILYLDKNFKQVRLMFTTRSRDLAVRRWNRRAKDDTGRGD